MIRTIHVVIPTHTTQHLYRTLMGVANQNHRADSVVVTCDNDEAGIVDVARRAATDFSMPIRVVQRPHQGCARRSQTRNNGVRALENVDGPGAYLVFFDGDCFAGPHVLETYDRLARDDRLLIGFRIDLTEEQTARFDETAPPGGRFPVTPTDAQFATLEARHRRYARHARLRRFRLAKEHKPKLLSANFCIPLTLYRHINGFDERYEGYGQEDDDLGRRCYRAGARPIVTVRESFVLHQYHASDAPPAWHDAPNAALFRQPYETRCAVGLENPKAQDGALRVVSLGENA